LESKKPKAISLRFLASANGKASTLPENLAYDTPFFVELVFNDQPDAEQKTVTLRLGLRPKTAITVYRDKNDPLRFVSQQIILDKLPKK